MPKSRFESCPDYKRVSYSKKTGKTGVLKDMWVRVPQRRQLPMAELVDALVKNGNPHLVR